MTIQPPPTEHPGRRDACAGELRWLPPTEIQEDPSQPRQDFPPPDQAGLAESIAASGIKVPLLVRQLPDGSYHLTDGARRLRAARTVGLDLVPCVVSDDGGWLTVRQDQLLANAQRLDLTPLEDAQAMYLLWIGRQIEALEAEQVDDGATTAHLLADGSTPTQQIAVLEARLCTLADRPSVAAYLGGGPTQVRVTWQAVLHSIGRGDWTADRRKKHLAVLQLDPTVQEALAGLPISARTLRDLAQVPPEAQRELVAQVTADDATGDVGAALRAALTEGVPGPQDPTDDQGTAAEARGEVGGFDVNLDLLDDGAADEAAADHPFSGALAADADQRSAWTPDRDLALPFSHGPGQKLVSERGPIGRGSLPPPGHDLWSKDEALQLSTGLETLLQVFDDIGPKSLTDDHQRWLRPLWRDLVTAMERAGLHVDD